MNNALLTSTEVEASTALTEAMVELARVMAASHYHNPGGLSDLEVVYILLHSDHFITGLWAGCIQRMVEDKGAKE